jgi:NTE family protein
MFKKPKIGIALSGGGARGLAHIGVLEVLDGLGVQIDAVSGTSMGAIVGAVYSVGTDLKEIESYLSSIDWKTFLVFSAFQLSRAGVVNEKKLSEVLKKFLGNKGFKDCRKQFCCVAVDILSSKKIIINTGSLREAVMASIAFPGIFTPVSKKNNLLVDGGIIEPLPTEAIKILDVNFIIASSIIFESALPENKKEKESGQIQKLDGKNMSIQTIIDKSLNIMHAQMVKSYEALADIVIRPRIGDFGFFDFGKSHEIIEAGRIAAIEKIPEIKKLLKIR